MIFCAIVALCLAVLGVAFFTGHAARYIKGYRELPEQEKQGIRIRALLRNVSVMFFAMAGIFAAAALFEAFRLGYLKYALGAWAALVCADVLYIERSGRYVKRKAAKRRRR